MKNYLSSLLKLLTCIILASALAACNGITLSGKIVGLSGTIVLDDGLGQKLSITQDGNFKFSATQYATGTTYNVTVATQPQGQSCTVVNGTGTFGSKAIDDIRVYCTSIQASQAQKICGNQIAAAGSAFQLDSSPVALNTGLGAAGFSTFDSNQNGFKEILFATGIGFGTGQSFAVIEFDETKNRYRPICQSDEMPAGIVRIIPFKNDAIANGTLIALADNSIKVFNHNLGTQDTLVGLVASQINDAALGDADNDGNMEILLLTDANLVLVDANTFKIKSTIPYGGKKLALGHLTDKSSYQIAINNGLVLGISTSSTDIVWDYRSIGFGTSKIAAGDLDGDGLDEIVAADGWQNIRIFNADTKGMLWTYSTSQDIAALQVFDTNNDGLLEVVYGDGQWGSIYGLEGKTGKKLWSVANPNHSVTDILVDNFNNDPGVELVWGAGHTSSGADYLYIHDLTASKLEWQSPELSGPFDAVAWGDLNGDGEADKVYASLSSQSGYGDGIATAVNSQSGEVLWRTNPTTFGGSAWTGIHALAVGDVDNDRLPEVVVGTGRFYDGVIYILNGQDGSIKKTINLESGSPIYSVLIDDIDGDGHPEIIASGGMATTGATGSKVYLVDGVTGTLKRTLPALTGNWMNLWSMRLIDLDGDGVKEIVVIGQDAWIYKLSNNGLTKTTNGNILSLATINRPAPDGKTAYLGNAAGGLLKLNADATATPVANICSAQIVALESVSNHELAFVCEGKLGLYDLTSGTISWQTAANFDHSLGQNNSLRYANTFGKDHLLVGGNRVYDFIRTGGL